MISAPPPPPHRAPPRVISAPVIGVARTPSTGPIVAGPVVRSAPTATPTTAAAPPPPPNRVPSFVGATIHPQTAPENQQAPAAPLPTTAAPSSSVANSQSFDKESLRPQAPPLPSRTDMFHSIPMVQSGYFPSSERQPVATSQRNRVMTPTRSDFLKPASATVSWMAQEVPRFRYEPPPMLPQYFEVERVANTPVRERRRLSEAAGELPNDMARRSRDYDERSFRSFQSGPSDGEEYRDFPSSTRRKVVPIVSKEDFERRGSTTPVRAHGSRAPQRAIEEEEYEIADRSSQRIWTTRDGVVQSPQSGRHRRGHSGRRHSAHDDEYVVVASHRQRQQLDQQPESYEERAVERREQPQRMNRYVDAEVVHNGAQTPRDDENEPEYQVGRRHRTAVSVAVDHPRRQSPDNYVVGKTAKQVSRELLVEVERSNNTTSPTSGRRFPTETEEEYRARRRAEREQRRMMAR